jgi:beta-mannosidase
MPDMKTINQFALPGDLDTSSKVMKVHQKHPFGYENIKLYIENKFRTPNTFEDLVYVSQLMQADAIRTAIEAHRTDPKNSGTIFWQWNDCWPVTSWSAIDYYGRKKALYYEVKRSFADSVLTVIKKENGFAVGVITDNRNSTDLISTLRIIPFDDFDTTLKTFRLASFPTGKFTFIPFRPALNTDRIFRNCFMEYTVHGSGRQSIVKGFLLADPKDVNLPNAKIEWDVWGEIIEVTADKFAYGVFIDVPDGVELDDNYFNLMPGETRYIRFTSTVPLETIKRSITIKSLVDTYTK